MPRLEGLRVAPSRIHGYGVYAARAFKKGDVVVHGDGVVWSEDDEIDDTYALVLPGMRVDEAGALVEDGPDVYYDLVDQTRWINHSCEPNTEVDSTIDPATGAIRAWWFALRDIEPGDELAYDYAFFGHLAEPCGCGSATCRGLIVDPDPEELASVPDHLRPLLRIGASRAAERA